MVAAVVSEILPAEKDMIVVSDDHSNHDLPIGARVTRVPAPTWAASADDGDWYSLGGDDDEVAIDPRDLAIPPGSSGAW